MKKIRWNNYPFPYVVIDNFLPKNKYDELIIELDNTNNLIQEKFNTHLENKTIFKDIFSKRNVKEIIQIMGSEEIKSLISEKINSNNIFSMKDIDRYAGYSPYHITENFGCLGSHVDHSYIKKEEFQHIANTIYFASTRWEKDWGGETIFFSNNGFFQKIKIEPIPNRLIIFVHTANSFHGVSTYYSKSNVERRTFYHDYYVRKNEINKVMSFINKNRKKNLKHSFHETTFIPFFPFGLNSINLKKIIQMENFKYLKTYIRYLKNSIFRVN